MPESVLSARAVQDEKFAIKYLMGNVSEKLGSATHKILRQDLTRSLGRTQTPVFESLRSSIENTWGLNDTDWNEVTLFKTMQNAVFRAMNCVMVGQPLCEEERYLDSLFRFTAWLGACAVLIGHYTPWFLSPVFGNIASIPVSIYKRRSMRFLLPAVQERMRSIRESESDVSSTEPKDLISWIILSSEDIKDVEVADIILSLVSISQMK